MRRFWPLLLFILIFAVTVMLIQSKPVKPVVQTDSTQRIISLAPNITEILFALDLGSRTVAVTDYCDYPEQVSQLPSVGGLFNPNIEVILSQHPDLVILSASQQHLIQQLQYLNIPTLAVHSATLDDIKNTITAIGKRTSHQFEAKQLLSSLENKITAITEKVHLSARPSVMLSLGNSSSSQLNTVYIAGQNDFYNDLITLAGGTNVYQSNIIDVPTLSVESIIQLNPDIIIDIYPEADDHHVDLEQVQQRWHSLSHVNAIKNNHIYIVEESYATIPGPRIILLLEQFARLIHPELQWDKITP